VIKEIGSGSFSRVYRATHRLSGLDYALKRSRNPLTRDAERNRWLQAGLGGGVEARGRGGWGGAGASGRRPLQSQRTGLDPS
jgi:serine/threonine protein kinase